jgi:hypothetical protein
MELKEITSNLQAPSLSQGWHNIANEWDGTDEPGRFQALSFIHERRDNAVKALEDIGDPDQLSETLAILYIKLKSEWIMLNTMTNYQLFHTGKNDGQAVLKGALISNFLQVVEDLLSAEDISTITSFLAAPIRPKAPSSAMVIGQEPFRREVA